MKQLTPLSLSLLQLRIVGLSFVAALILSLLLIELLPPRLRIIRKYTYGLMLVSGSAVSYCLVVFQSTVK